MLQNSFNASIRKTDKINIDDKSHKLPPDNGAFQEFLVADYDCPESWSKDGVFIPVKEGDPMWFDFRHNDECAVIVSVQKVNPITGEKSEMTLNKNPKQNYLKMPEQKWLDGYSNDGKVYQFIVTKSGIMQAVNEYVLPLNEQDSYAIGFAFFAPKNPKPKADVYPFNFYSQPKYDDCMIDAHPEWIGSKKKSYLRCSSVGISVGKSYSQAIDNNLSYLPECEIVNCCNIDTEQKTSSKVFASVDLESVGINHDLSRGVAQPEIEHVAFDKASMGQGGRIAQEIINDNNTVEYYKDKPDAILTYYLCLPEHFEAIMKKGKKSDANRQDKFTNSGLVGGIQIPLIK